MADTDAMPTTVLRRKRKARAARRPPAGWIRVALGLVLGLSAAKTVWLLAQWPWQAFVYWVLAPLALLGLWHLPGHLRHRSARGSTARGVDGESGAR